MKQKPPIPVIDLLLTEKENSLRGPDAMDVMRRIQQASIVGVIYDGFIEIVKNRLTDEIGEDSIIWKKENPEYFL